MRQDAEGARTAPPIDRISVELTNTCAKACWFCYNHSHAQGATVWTPDELVGFATDCAAHGVKALSLGGGEPLQYEGLFEVLERLDGVLFRSMTTNGLLLRDEVLERLVAARPDKVHVSVHFPERPREVERVIAQVGALAGRGIASGVNLLVQRSKLEAAAEAAAALREAGIDNRRVVYLPMRGQDTPTPRELARVAGDQPFQSMTCLARCAASPRFCAVTWDRRVAWCSYTTSRNPLAAPTWEALIEAMRDLGLAFCGPEAA